MSKTKAFPVAELRELLAADNDIVLNTLVEKDRWSLLHRLVFVQDGQHYETHYRIGSTEYQDERPWEGETVVNCKLVEPYEKTITDYRPVP